MLTSEAIVEILGAGLSSHTRAAIKGELDGYRRPHRSGRPVADSELLPIAVTITVSARFRRVNAEHLPTLVSLGGLLVLMSHVLAIVQGYVAEGDLASWIASYGALLVFEAVLVSAFLCRGVPTRSLALASCLHSLALLANLLALTPETVAETAVHVLVYVVTVWTPVLFLSLAWKCRRGCAWSQLPGVLQSDALTRVVGRAMTYLLLAATLGKVGHLVADGGELVLVHRVAGGSAAIGLGLLWAGFHSVTARPAT